MRLSRAWLEPARAPGLSTRGAAAAGRGRGRGGVAGRHAQVQRHAHAAIAGQGAGEPAGRAVHARFQGARHGAARARSRASRGFPLAGRRRADRGHGRSHRSRLELPGRRAASRAIRWPSRSKPTSTSRSNCRRAWRWRRVPAWSRACWCSAFRARVASRQPVDPAALESAWMKTDHAMVALTPGELLEDDVEQRLVRMFGADEVRVFGGHEVKFECRCSRERVANVLRSLGVEEVRCVHRRAGRGHRHLRVLPEAVQVRRHRRRTAVHRRRRRAAATRSIRLFACPVPPRNARALPVAGCEAKKSNAFRLLVRAVMRHRMESKFDSAMPCSCSHCRAKMSASVSNSREFWRAAATERRSVRRKWSSRRRTTPWRWRRRPPPAALAQRMPAAHVADFMREHRHQFIVGLRELHQLVGHDDDPRRQREGIRDRPHGLRATPAGTRAHRRAPRSSR